MMENNFSIGISTIFFAVVLSNSLTTYAGVVDRIFPKDTTVNRFSIRSLANGKYVGIDANNQLVATDVVLSQKYFYEITKLGGDKIAIRNLSNGKYVTAENGGASSLVANRESPGSWETFTVIDLGGYNVAFLASANSNYVTAEVGGSSPLIANRNSVSTWETFRLLPVIDMAEVLTAFPKKYQNYVKNISYSQNTGCAFFHNKKVYERWVSGKVGREIVNISVSADNVRILDWIWLAADKVGNHGTFPLCQESASSSPSTCSVGIWDPMIPLARRYLTPDMGVDSGTVPETIEGAFLEYAGISTSNSLTCQNNCNTKSHGNEVHRFSYEPMNGNIGARWYVKIATNTNKFTGVKEYFTWDLGPSINTYRPEFGWIIYEQTQKNGCPDYPAGGGYTIEKYGNLALESTLSGGFYEYFWYQ